MASMQSQPYIVCPKCGMVSHNPNDVQHRYCGNCHAFHDDLFRTAAQQLVLGQPPQLVLGPPPLRPAIATPPGEVIARFASIARPIMRKWMPSNSCIGAARTTIEVMRIYGLRAVEKPVCWAFHVEARKYARLVGFTVEERAEMKARAAAWKDVTPEGGGWNGHILVLVENRWLLDPSIDQANAPQFGVSVPAEVFVLDTAGQEWNPCEDFDIDLGLALDNGDKVQLKYRSISDRSYLDTEAWTDEGLPLLAHAIARVMEATARVKEREGR